MRHVGMDVNAVICVGDTRTPASDTAPVPVSIKDASINIESVDFDMRDLAAATDSVAIEPGVGTLKANPAPVRGATNPYRTSVSGADKMVAPTLTATDNTAVAGSLAAAAHTAVVVAYNDRGAVASPMRTVTPADADSAVDLTIGEVPGATGYRIYFCLCGSDPHFLFELTPEQWAAGGVLDGSPVSGSANDPATPGVITVKVAGSGTETAAMFTNLPNTAYVLPGADPIVCTGKATAIVTVTLTPDWSAAPVCKIIPFLQNGSGEWAQGAVLDMEPLSTGHGLVQTFNIAVNGAAGLHLLAEEISGCTAAIEVELA